MNFVKWYIKVGWVDKDLGVPSMDHFCCYLLPEQDSGTSQISVNATQLPEQMDHLTSHYITAICTCT